ncbi:fimbrial biogenesis chaperone [Hydrogenophaga sp. PBL-H3]|uniref:fimbrial biogenesis chaperone n=1 Tax=Hydrogenophaga sp. PBL-H3 TaxID=434010 RepID=UPI00132036E5|nr:fimbria/pilus periplasmic chaperone [Hydrogenophaga sp. PBL-H3]QHE75087.1 molecular chaperone [Hydrogenophaga sp. PBL-H3]QHE79514.1 molecular chaperone [Hydrogenophaga sp. PBL-H3]
MTARAPLAHWLGAAALALLVAAAGWPAQVHAFQVRPVRLDLGNRQPTAQLMVSNPTSRPLLIQAEAFDWSQEQDRDQLQPSQDLIVNPPIFELAPGAQQVVRVGLRRAAKDGVERPHRIWLTQVATTSDEGDNGVQMLLRLSLPVFVTGTGTGAALAEWQRHAQDGVVELNNPGARHLHVRELRLLADDATPTSLGPCYALPGGRCRWPLPTALRHKTLRIEADSDAGTLRSQFDAVAAQ